MFEHENIQYVCENTEQGIVLLRTSDGMRSVEVFDDEIEAECAVRTEKLEFCGC